MTATRLTLLAFADAFDALHSEWLGMPEGDDRDDTVDRLNELADAIRITPAVTMAEATIKARNLLWAFGLTHAGAPALDDDPALFELAAFVHEFERLIGAVST